MFSRTIEYTTSRIVNRLFYALTLVLMSLSAHAVNTPAEASTMPVGSHADASVQFANARHLWQNGKLKEAAALYESLIERFPDLPDPYNNLAVIYAAQGDYKKAQQILEKGLNTHPGYAAIYENLTAIYVEMARDSYGKALQFDDKSHRQLKLRALAELSIKPVQIAKVEAAVAPPPVVTASDVAEAPVAVARVETPAVVNTPEVTSATDSVKPVAAVEASPAPQALDRTAITTTLESWASAWSAQSVEQYLSFYEPNYHPPGLSRRRWEAQRAERIKRPQWIRVSLSDFAIQADGENRVRVEVQQRYQSNTYSDKGRKEFILLESAEGWRIVSERNR